MIAVEDGHAPFGGKEGRRQGCEKFVCYAIALPLYVV